MCRAEKTGRRPDPGLTGKRRARVNGQGRCRGERSDGAIGVRKCGERGWHGPLPKKERGSEGEEEASGGARRAKAKKKGKSGLHRIIVADESFTFDSTIITYYQFVYF
jgi:hypothetical protein